MQAHGLLRVAPVLALALAVSGLTGCATHDYRTRRRAQASPYEMMRDMAYDLDQRAHETASRAMAMSRRGRRDDEVAERMTKFAKKTAEFRQKVDRRGHKDRDDVADDLHDLDNEARKVTDEMRKERGGDRLWDDWDAVLETLRGMDRIAADYAADTRYRNRGRR